MKFLSALLVLVALAGVTYAEPKEKRMNVGAQVGANLGINIPTAYPTIPTFVNQLTSMLFSPNQTSGITPIYGLLKQLTSNIYPFLANTTYNILKPLNNIINGISSNLYNGLCAPPMPNITNPWGGTTGGATGGNTGTSPTTNPLTNIFNLFGSPGTSGATTGTSGTDPISQLLSALTGGASGTSSALTSLLSALTGGASGASSGLQSLLNALTGGATGATSGTTGGTTSGTASGLQSLLNALLGGTTGTTGTTTSGTNPLAGILNTLGLGALAPLSGATSGTGTSTGGTGTGTGGTGTSTGGTTGLGSFFPNTGVTGTVNLTLNLSPLAFVQLLSSLGQTPQSLQSAIQALGGNAQSFVNGLAQFSGNVLAYLQAIFAQAGSSAPTTSTGGTNTLQGLVNNVLNSLNGALAPTGLVSTLNGLLQSLLG